MADPPPIALPNTDGPVIRFGKAWWTLASIQASVLATVLGAYFSLKGDIDKQAQRIDTIAAWLKDPDRFPGSKTITVPYASGSSASRERIPETDLSAQERPKSVGIGTLQVRGQGEPIGMLKAAERRSPPVCVHRGTLRKMACELASEGTCLGKDGFTIQRYQEIQSKAGVMETMLVCDSVNDRERNSEPLNAP